MQTTFALLQHQRVTPHCQNADRLPPVLDAGDPHDLRPIITFFLHQIRITELVLRECLDVRYRLTPETLGEEVDLVTLNVFNDEDIETFEEIERRLVYGVTKDGLLEEEDVAARLFDFLAEVEEVCSAFLDDLVHLAVVVDDDRVVHLETM